MDGIFLIDKQQNMTSFDVIRQLRKKFNILKMGHAGTLDPFATGLLIILVGKATKLSKFLLQENKTYVTTFTFGKHTDTYDVTGQIRDESQHIPSLESIIKTIDTMKTYQQEPPMYSAVKQNGQKLVDLARKGIEIKRLKKDVHIFDYSIMSYKKPELMLSLDVSKGTYIRSLAVDLAAHLNTFAHVSSLRRTKSGTYTIEQAKTIEHLTKNDLVTIEDILQDYPKITVSAYIAEKVYHGLVMDERQYQGDIPFRVYNEEGAFIGFYEVYQNNTYKPVFTLTHETI